MRDYALHYAQQTEQLQSYGLLTQLWHNWKARRDLRRLQDLDDNLLKDIGLTRAHIVRAYRLPLTLNATSTLAQWRAEPPRCAA